MYLQEVVQLAAFKVLQDYVDRVVSLVDSLQPHHAFVVESAHQFDLVLEGLPSLVSGVLLFL